MEKIVDYLGYIAAAVGGFFAWLYGPASGVIFILLIVISVDYVTGVMKAGYKGELSSEVGFKGLLKKVCILLVVALGALADKAIPATNGAAEAAVCIFYVANEGLSICENVGEMGVTLPGWLTKLLAQVKDDSGEKLEDKDEDQKA